MYSVNEQCSSPDFAKTPSRPFDRRVMSETRSLIRNAGEPRIGSEGGMGHCDGGYRDR